MLSLGEFSNVTVHVGAKTAYPSFDISLKEKSLERQRYWCELEAWQNTTKQKRKSTYWSSGYFVDFSSSLNGTSSEHHGRCTVDGFTDHFEKEYQIRFYTDLGTQTENLVGYFLMMRKLLFVLYKFLIF